MHVVGNHRLYTLLICVTRAAGSGLVAVTTRLTNCSRRCRRPHLLCHSTHRRSYGAISQRSLVFVMGSPVCGGDGSQQFIQPVRAVGPTQYLGTWHQLVRDIDDGGSSRPLSGPLSRRRRRRELGRGDGDCDSIVRCGSRSTPTNARTREINLPRFTQPPCNMQRGRLCDSRGHCLGRWPYGFRSEAFAPAKDTASG